MTRLAILGLVGMLGCADAEEVEAALMANPLSDLEEVPAERFWGTVQSTLSAGPYTYVEVQTCHQQTRWVVGLDKALSPGAAVSVLQVGLARDFHSGRTGRTWEELWFGVLRPETHACASDQNQP